MSEKISVAILGSTGYVGLELVKILSKHINVDLVFLGTEKSPNIEIKKFDFSIDNFSLPKTQLNRDFDYNIADTVFLALPHSVSNQYVKLFYNKTGNVKKLIYKTPITQTDTYTTTYDKINDTNFTTAYDVKVLDVNGLDISSSRVSGYNSLVGKTDNLIYTFDKNSPFIFLAKACASSIVFL